MADAAYGLWPFGLMNTALIGAFALSLLHPSAVHHHGVGHIRRESATGVLPAEKTGAPC